MKRRISFDLAAPIETPAAPCPWEMLVPEELAVPAGTALASCTLPFEGGGVGSETFSLFTGNEFATDGGEMLTTLFFYQEPTTVGGSCVQVGSGVPIVGATGLNFASNGDCIYTNGLGSTFNGGTNCDVVLSSTTNAFPSEEDLTCTTLGVVGAGPTLCKLAHPITAPEFGGPLSAILAAAVAMVGVVFLARRKSSITIFSRT